MCAPVSISMAPTLALPIPAIVASVITGIAGVALLVKGVFAKPRGV